MPSAAPQPSPSGKVPAFTIALCALALMAITQLLIAGMALATRFEESQKVKIVEKTVATPVIVRVPDETAAQPAIAPIAPATSPVPKPPTQPIPQPEIVRQPKPVPLREPEIADPRAEKLFVEARGARIAGDMGKAIVKLEEAATQAPDNPSVRYELGLIHEQMGVYDVATSYYQKVFEMGVSQAGRYYHLAGKKLRDGFEKSDAMLGKLSLGRVRIFQNPDHPKGHQVILTIPVQKAPNEEIDIAELEVSVVFFNRNSKGEIVQLEDNSWVSQEWTSLPFDWAGGEESLRMTYIIPKVDDATRQLFGSLSYYGQAVSLMYKSEIMAVQAWPSMLAARIPRGTSDANSPLPPEFQDSLPPDFNPDAPLLPALPEN
jgi:tetratricopeptide (TPR) repeat protein